MWIFLFGHFPVTNTRILICELQESDNISKYPYLYPLYKYITAGNRWGCDKGSVSEDTWIHIRLRLSWHASGRRGGGGGRVCVSPTSPFSPSVNRQRKSLVFSCIVYRLLHQTPALPTARGLSNLLHICTNSTHVTCFCFWQLACS